MLYLAYCLDNTNSVALRNAKRDENWDYFMVHKEKLKIAGPILAEQDEKTIGSLMIIEAASHAEALHWVKQTPFAKAGLFNSIDIRPWKWVIGKPKEI